MKKSTLILLGVVSWLINVVSVFLIISFIIFFSAVVSLYSDDEYEDVVLDSLPEYEDCNQYQNGFWQDFTLYAEYYYEDIDESDFADNEYFEPVHQDDALPIQAYLFDYENWVDLKSGEKELFNDDISEVYNFGMFKVKEGDWFYINGYDKGVAVDGTETFDSVDIYYFSMEEQTLYFMHNNI